MVGISGKSWLAVALLAGNTTYSVAAAPIVGDPAKGEALVSQSCVNCHGEAGNSVVPNFPKLSAQSPRYLLHEMKDFHDGKRKSELMGDMLSKLSDEDMANIALYFAAQKRSDGVVGHPELLALGKKIYLEGNTDSGVPSCDGCHETNGYGSERFPRVAGQNVDYTLAELKSYATDVRTNGMKAMRTIAHRLTEQEAQAVAEYIASLK